MENRPKLCDKMKMLLEEKSDMVFRKIKEDVLAKKEIYALVKNGIFQAGQLQWMLEQEKDVNVNNPRPR